MTSKHIMAALAAIAVLGGGGYGMYWLGMRHAMPTASTASGAPPVAGLAQAGDRIDPATGRHVLYWHDPMVPGHRFDKPGKSPFMDMELVPVYADEAGDEGRVSVSPRVQQNLGIRTAEATTGSLASTVEVVGSVAYNERSVALVQARSNGFVERLYVRAPLDPVKQGQALVQLYVPDWVAAQEEYLSVSRMQASGVDALVDAARQRMRLTGMNEEQIRVVETSGKVQARMTLTAPMSGIISELSVRDGMTVMAGAPLFKINGLETVWVNAEVPEAAAAGVRPGVAVQARTPALPGETFQGKVGALLPEVNPATRTLKARIELANPGQRLVPGMFATVSLTPAARKDAVLVPSEAVIRTGQRNVVMVVQSDGSFMPVDVEIGAEANGQTEVRRSVQAGQKVVTSGQFLIDSEASLKGTIGRMAAPAQPDSSDKTGQQAANNGVHHGQGKVESIGKDEVTLSHGPIPSLQWGPMTMGFKLPPTGMPKGVTEGAAVAFDFRVTPDGAYEITAMTPATGAATQPNMPGMGAQGAKK
jgi:Cu(I)/Ag(I) efflux system membrane fusion protein